jgi:type I restriction enzyme S subunit
MNADVLIKHFDRISESPNAIPRLRQFILDLAVRGKLVEQDPSEEPACELLKRIRVAKAALSGRNCGLSTVSMCDKPLAEPSGWLWVRVGDIFSIRTGFAFKSATYSDKGTLVFRVTNFNRDGCFDLSDSVYFPTEKIDEKISKYLLQRGEVIMVMVGGTIGKTTIVNETILPALLNQNMWRIRSFGALMSNRFEYLIIRAINQRIQNATQSTHGHFAMSDYELKIIPLPPLAEQYRIVAKVDELMALCDRLEETQKERERRRDRLTAASVHYLSSRVDEEETVRHARFFINHLPKLTARPELVEQLRQTILTLAVRGNLVSQDPTDEHVSTLLERILKGRANLTDKRIVKPDRRNVPIPEDAIPFAIPDSWQWMTLRDLVVFGPQNGISPRPSARLDAPKAVTLTATTSGRFNPTHYKRVEANIPKDSEFWLRSGDLLFQRGNTPEYVGMAAYYIGGPGEFLYPDLMIKLRVSDEMDLRYVHLCATSPSAREYFSSRASGAQKTMPKINQETLLRLPVPIAPLAEQKRIVERVDELMAMCDQLENEVSAQKNYEIELLEAVLRRSLPPVKEVDSDSAKLSSQLKTEDRGARNVV